MLDSLIIGGGPTGLSAAIYLGQFGRSVVVVSKAGDSSSFERITENYLGFPNGVSSRELVKLGKEQARRFNVHLVERAVDLLERTGDAAGSFTVHIGGSRLRTRSLLLATGITDEWPKFPTLEQWIGKQVFSCVVCDGYQTTQKKVICFGKNTEAFVKAQQLLRFTKHVTLITPRSMVKSSCLVSRPQGQKLKVICGEPKKLLTDAEKIVGVLLSSGEELSCDLLFSFLGVVPNVRLAKQLRVSTDEDNFIVIDKDFATNVNGVYAAGDVTNRCLRQVSAAVHAGAEAAKSINYFLQDIGEPTVWNAQSHPELQITG